MSAGRGFLSAVPDDVAGIDAFVKANSVAWNCPDCGDDLALMGKDTPLPGDLRCHDCQMKSARREDGSRDVFLRMAGVPERFRLTAFEEPKIWPRDSRFELDVAAWNGKPWAVGFLGASRTGKTMLAVELLWRMRRFTRSPYFIRADRLVSCLFGDAGEDEKVRVYREVNDAPVLVVDDLGWGALGKGIERLFEVLANRHEDLRPTIWTSNHKREDLVARNAPMMRRLEEGIVAKLADGRLWKSAEPDGRDEPGPYWSR